MLNIDDTVQRLKKHVAVLTKEIGERSVYEPRGLKLAGEYIEGTYREAGLVCHREEYTFGPGTVANIVAEASTTDRTNPTIWLGPTMIRWPGRSVPMITRALSRFSSNWPDKSKSMTRHDGQRGLCHFLWRSPLFMARPAWAAGSMLRQRGNGKRRSMA